MNSCYSSILYWAHFIANHLYFYILLIAFELDFLHGFHQGWTWRCRYCGWTLWIGTFNNVSIVCCYILHNNHVFFSCLVIPCYSFRAFWSLAVTTLSSSWMTLTWMLPFLLCFSLLQVITDCLWTVALSCVLLMMYVLFIILGTAGQRCTTLRRLVLHEKIYDEFVAKLVSGYSKVLCFQKPKTRSGTLLIMMFLTLLSRSSPAIPLNLEPFSVPCTMRLA